MKTNHKSLQKQHGYKPHYILKNIIKIKNTRVSKPSMSYEFKAVFGCCKTFSGKYIFSGNVNFRKRKMHDI